MWFPDLTGRTINQDSAFISYVWAELFDFKTPINYTSRLQDTLSLVEELENVARKAEIDSKWQKNLPYIISELKKVAESDAVIIDRYPFFQFSITKLPNPDDIPQVRKVVEILKTQLLDYENNVHEHLLESIKSLPVLKGKGYKIIEAIRCLVPECRGVKCTMQIIKETLWDKYYTAAPLRQRHFAEQYKIVKKA